ncbi:MAG: hypothetical protein R3B48_19980 [Kofleriaceae bacterium]
MSGPPRGGVGRDASGARSTGHARLARLVRLGLAAAALVARPSFAAAQSLSLDPVTARGVAHAGAGFVADDAAAVWSQNPAGAARREADRAVVGVSSVDTDLQIRPDLGRAAPVAVSRANAGVAPQLTLTGSWGETMLGLSVLSGQRLGRRFEVAPGDGGQGARTSYPLHYAGLAGALRRESLTVGAARRLGDTVAIGLSVGAARVQLKESRRLWAGLESFTSVGDPVDDLSISIDGVDGFVPSVSASAIYAPTCAPLEVAAGLTAVGGADLRGELRAEPTSADGPRLTGNPATASVALPGALVLRSGVRWQAERWAAEVDAQLELTPRRARDLAWSVRGLSLEHRSGAQASLIGLPAQLSLRSSGAARGAVDVEVIRGWLWLVLGAGWSVTRMEEARVTPGFADLGGLTLAGGAEISAGGVTVTLGLSRAWSRSVVVDRSVRRLDNPFGEGDGVTGLGRYRAATDVVGISVEIERR